MNRRHLLAWALLLGAGATDAHAQVIYDRAQRTDGRRNASVVCADRSRERERNRDRDRNDSCDRGSERLREQCMDAVRDYAHQRTELQQRLRRQHADWHRTHEFTDRNYVRQHNQLHERLDRAQAEFDRHHGARVRQCERMIDGPGRDYDHDYDYDRQHRGDRARDQRRS